MAIKKEKVFGKLEVSNIPANLCWESPEKFIQQLTNLVGVTLDVGSDIDFVVIGHNPPSEDDKGRLWVRLATSGVFLGFYIFENGSWVQIQNRRQDEVVWLVGDSRQVPEGYQLIVPGIGGIPSDVVNHIVGMYKINIAATEASVGTVYEYFAARYVGTTGT